MPERDGTTDDFWDEFDSARFSFDDIGDRADGAVIEKRVEKGQSKRVPVLVLRTDDGEARELWAGPWDLQQKLAKARVEIGDRVTAVFVDEKNTGKGNPMKLFDVDVKQGRGDAGDFDSEAF